MLITAPPIEGSLKAGRLAANLSQTELAMAADCSLSSVQLFDRGFVPKASPVLDRVNAVLDEQLNATTTRKGPAANGTLTETSTDALTVSERVRPAY